MVTNSKFFLDIIYPKLLLIGNRICHQLDDRSFHFGIRKFPLCVRCTTLYLSFFIGSIIGIFTDPPIYILVILLFPMIIDGFIQLHTRYESNNLKRAITGILFGYAASSIIFSFI